MKRIVQSIERTLFLLRPSSFWNISTVPLLIGVANSRVIYYSNLLGLKYSNVLNLDWLHLVLEELLKFTCLIKFRKNFPRKNGSRINQTHYFKFLRKEFHPSLTEKTVRKYFVEIMREYQNDLINCIWEIYVFDYSLSLGMINDTVVGWVD